MRIRSNETINTEMCVWKEDNDKLWLKITEEDACGDVERISDININKEQAIKLANYILHQFK